MKKKSIVLALAALVLLSSCATMTRYIGGYSVRPYIGETEAQFRTTCPFVYHVNETVTANGVYRQYCMDSEYTHPRYVYFEDGRLTAMQN